jgi:hypothetical protein
MANNCYNWAHIKGSKESLDLLQTKIKEATSETRHLWYQTFYHVIGQPLPNPETNTYDDFGTKWFDAEWERDSDTLATLSGDSAWSPPCEFFLKLSEVYGLTIESDYEEPGCDFAGYYNCTNGKVTRDEQYSYNYFKLIQDKDCFMHDLVEHIACGTYEDYKDFAKHNQDVVAELSPKDIEEIKEQFNKITQ